MIDETYDEEIVFAEPPKTAICEKCFVFRALSGACNTGCDD